MASEPHFEQPSLKKPSLILKLFPSLPLILMCFSINSPKHQDKEVWSCSSRFWLSSTIFLAPIKTRSMDTSALKSNKSTDQKKKGISGFFCRLSSVGGEETRCRLWSVAKNGLSWQQAFLPDQIIDLCLCCVPAKPRKVDGWKDSGRLCGDQMGRESLGEGNLPASRDETNFTWGAASHLEIRHISSRHRQKIQDFVLISCDKVAASGRKIMPGSQRDF